MHSMVCTQYCMHVVCVHVNDWRVRAAPPAMGLSNCKMFTCDRWRRRERGRRLTGYTHRKKRASASRSSSSEREHLVNNSARWSLCMCTTQYGMPHNTHYTACCADTRAFVLYNCTHAAPQRRTCDNYHQHARTLHASSTSTSKNFHLLPRAGGMRQTGWTAFISSLTFTFGTGI